MLCLIFHWHLYKEFTVHVMTRKLDNDAEMVMGCPAEEKMQKQLTFPRQITDELV